MKKIGLALIVVFSMIFMSCASAIKVGKNVEKYNITSMFDNPDMEFIGFKIDSNILSTSSSAKLSAGVWMPAVDNVMSEYDQAKAISTTGSRRQLGYILESNGIAVNKMDSYFGIYSLQEMELYKSDKRYVTFVEVSKSKLDFSDNKGSKNLLGGVGAGFIGGGLPFLILGAAYNDGKNELAKYYMTMGGIFTGLGVPFAITALTPSKTKINFSGLYNIYLYDTQTKSLIRKDSVSVNLNEKFVGSYTYDDNSKDIVWTYISDNVYNAILKKYDELNKWLSSNLQK